VPKRRRRGRGDFYPAVRILEPVLLLLLHRGEAHGYTLLEQLGEFGLSEPDPSVVYRNLRDMEEKGWVVSTWDSEGAQGPPRRVYRLAPLGDELLSRWIEDLQETRATLNYLVEAYDRHIKEGVGEYHG
jgi:DNA-binding PadR family transcriptional regulator